MILWTTRATAAITTTCFQWNYLDFDRIFSLFSLLNFFDKIKATETAFKWKTVTLKIYFYYMANLIVANRSFEVNLMGKFCCLTFWSKLGSRSFGSKETRYSLELFILFKTKKMPKFGQLTRRVRPAYSHLKLSRFNSHPSFYQYWRQKKFSCTILFRIPDLQHWYIILYSITNNTVNS